MTWAKGLATQPRWLEVLCRFKPGSSHLQSMGRWVQQLGIKVEEGGLGEPALVQAALVCAVHCEAHQVCMAAHMSAGTPRMCALHHRSTCSWLAGLPQDALSASMAKRIRPAKYALSASECRQPYRAWGVQGRPAHDRWGLERPCLPRRYPFKKCMTVLTCLDGNGVAKVGAEQLPGDAQLPHRQDQLMLLLCLAALHDELSSVQTHCTARCCCPEGPSLSCSG